MASPRIESPIEQHSDSEEGEDNTGSNNEFDSSRFDTIDEPVSETIVSGN